MEDGRRPSEDLLPIPAQTWGSRAARERHSLTLDDYAWEIRGGGNPAIDLLDLEWNEDGVGEAVRFADLQSFLVVHLPALRDVEGDLRNPRQSPLIKLIESFEIPKDEQEGLIQILDKANNLIAKSKTISDVAQATRASKTSRVQLSRWVQS